MRRRFSCRSSGSKLKKCISLNVPCRPPSALAPLSLMIKTMVLSSSPRSAMESMSRPTQWSVCSRKPAYTSIMRAYSRRSSRCKGVPRRNPVGPFAQSGAGREQSRGRLAGEGLGPPFVPTLVEAAAVAVDECGRRLMRRVAGAGREVQEERFGGQHVAKIIDEEDRLVGQVLGQVIARFGRGRRVDLMVVVHQVGVVLIGLAGQEPVEPLEATAERPALAGARHGHLGRRREMPLADREGAVAGANQYLRQHPVGLGDGGVVAREAGRHLGDSRHAVAVVVAAGEQAGAGRGAQGGGVETRIAQAPGRQAVEGRRGDIGPVTSELGKAHVVQQDHHHVGCARRRRRQSWPPRDGVNQCPAYDTSELALTLPGQGANDSLPARRGPLLVVGRTLEAELLVNPFVGPDLTEHIGAR